MDCETCKEKRNVIAQTPKAESPEPMTPGELLVKIMNSTGARGTWEIVP